MKDSIFYKLSPNDSLRERLLHRFKNLLCRFGLHDWDTWGVGLLLARPGFEHRTCWHCTKQEQRQLNTGDRSK